MKYPLEIKISFNLKGEYKLSLGELEVDGFYKVKDGKVYLGSNKDFEIILIFSFDFRALFLFVYKYF